MKKITIFHKFLLKHFAFPLINSLLEKTGKRLYYYFPEEDLLTGFDQLPGNFYKEMMCKKYASFEWWVKLKNQNDNYNVAFDIGANKGYTSFWFSEISQKVYSFEPHPVNFEILKESLRIRQVKNIFPQNMAVADTNKTMDLFCKRASGHHSLADIGASKTIDKVTVECVTVDSFCEKAGITSIDFMKIDVEGFEAEVLIGADKLLSGKKICKILFEYTPSFYAKRNLPEDKNPALILRTKGYQLFDINMKEIDDLTSIKEQIDIIAIA